LGEHFAPPFFVINRSKIGVNKMAYTATTVFERPDTSVDWFITRGRTAVINVLSNFENAGKKISFSTTESDDGLTFTTEVVFDNKAAYDELHLDETFAQYFTERNTYYTNNNVVSNTSFAGS